MATTFLVPLIAYLSVNETIPGNKSIVVQLEAGSSITIDNCFLGNMDWLWQGESHFISCVCGFTKSGKFIQAPYMDAQIIMSAEVLKEAA